MMNMTNMMTTETSTVGKGSDSMDKDKRYVKVALDGAYLSNPNLLPFLIKLKNKNIKTGLKLSQKQFTDSNTLLKGLTDADLISEIEVSSHGLGDMQFIHSLTEFPNSVLHIE